MLDSPHFIQRIHSHMGGEPPIWQHGKGYVYEGRSKKILEKAQDFMREFCCLTDAEVEAELVNRSVAEAAKYSIKAKGERLAPDAEKVFLERCKGKKSRLASLMTYCGRWGIMPDNMTEITLVAGFEGGRRGRIGTEFMKKLMANKKNCRELLEQIMKMNDIPETEPISRVLEHLS
jgi:hypothetical protein